LYLRLLLLRYTNEEITTILLRNVNYKQSLNKNNTITTASELAKTKLPNNFPSPPTQLQQQIPATTNKQNPPLCCDKHFCKSSQNAQNKKSSNSCSSSMQLAAATSHNNNEQTNNLPLTRLPTCKTQVYYNNNTWKKTPIDQR
jgi:hypothetical protein